MRTARHLRRSRAPIDIHIPLSSQSRRDPVRRAERSRDYLNQGLESAAATRCAEAVDRLTRLRTVRQSIEHGDARMKAVAAYANLGVAFPVRNWPEAWARISAVACGALDAIREEVHAGSATS